MNKFYTLIFLITFPFLTYSQWYESNIDSSYRLHTASFLNKDTFLVLNNNKLELTVNGGETFNPLPNYPLWPSDYLHYKNFDTIYVAPELGFNAKGIFASYDAGNSWSKQKFLMPNGDSAFDTKPVIFLGFFDQNNGIAWGDSLNGIPQVFLTQNGGRTWEFYAHPSINKVIYSDLQLFSTFSTDVYNYLFSNGTGKLLIGLENRLLTLSQYGKEWCLDTVLSHNLRFAAFKDTLNGLGQMFVMGELVMAKTTDGGITWNEMPNDQRIAFDHLLYVKSTPKVPGFYLASSTSAFGESNISYDDGVSWKRFDSINHGSGNVFFRDAETGVCTDATPDYSPVYYYKPFPVGLKETTFIEKNGNICYPNPAHNEINFIKPFANIEIWDLQGKLIAADINTNHLDISSLSNGLYIIKAIDGNQIPATQKLVIQH